MREGDECILIEKSLALQALAELEFILISLHKIGSYYMGEPVEDYRRATTDFIDNNAVTHRLAKVRKIISEPFDSALGVDDMDEIERYLSNIEFWCPDSV